jgi:hypothetical protein
MPGQQRGLTQLWQELKRRKVVRVITVYAAAFVIIELINNVTFVSTPNTHQNEKDCPAYFMLFVCLPVISTEHPRWTFY